MGCCVGGLVLYSAWHVWYISASFTHFQLMWTTLHPLNLYKKYFCDCVGVQSQNNEIWKSWSWSGKLKKNVVWIRSGLLKMCWILPSRVLKSGSCTPLVVATQQRWADCEIFQSESSPAPTKLNPIQSWSAKFLKIMSPIQSWSANVKLSIIFCLMRQKHCLSYFAFSQIQLLEGKIVPSVLWHMRQNRHSFLALQKFNMAVSILPSEDKALLDSFCH